MGVAHFFLQNINKMPFLGMISVFFLFFNKNTYAQSMSGKVVLGLNAAQVDGDFIWGFNKPAINSGLAGTMKISNNTWLQLEILYSVRGASSTINQTFLKTSYDYIDFPLVVHFLAYKNFFLQVGFQAAYLLSACYDNSGGGYVNIKNSTNTMDYSLMAAGEYQLGERFAFNVRYTYSVVPFNQINVMYTATWFHNYLTFGLRYIIIK